MRTMTVTPGPSDPFPTFGPMPGRACVCLRRSFGAFGPARKPLALLGLDLLGRPAGCTSNRLLAP